MADHFSAAVDAERAAILAVADGVFLAGNVAFGLFEVLIGAAIIIFSLAMLQGRFPRWLGWLGLATGVLYRSSVLSPIILSLSGIAFVVWIIIVEVQLIQLKS